MLFSPSAFNASLMKDQTQSVFQVAAFTNILLVKRDTITILFEACFLRCFLIMVVGTIWSGAFARQELLF